ncbi:MAG: response regulator transcription factor [bacterium]
MKILVVDDDPRLRDLVTIALERADFSVITAANGQQALTHAARENPDLIVLDIGLPELDGLEVCRRLRARSQIPILFLTARADEIDRVLGLEMGGDDYVTKPFSPRELVARVRSILKRSARVTASQTLRHGILSLDAARHACQAAQTPVTLTAAEMALLSRLMQHPDLVWPRARLIDEVWDGDISDRTLDSHLRNLRRKLAEAGCAEAIETLHGIGIRMGPCR